MSKYGAAGDERTHAFITARTLLDRPHSYERERPSGMVLEIGGGSGSVKL